MQEDHVVDLFDTAAYVDDAGIVRWSATNEVPQSSVLTVWRDHNKPFEFDLSDSTRKYEEIGFLRKYIEGLLLVEKHDGVKYYWEKIYPGASRYHIVDALNRERFRE